MGKFYFKNITINVSSIMIKKLFFASALIISAALTFVACGGDDDDDNQSSLTWMSWVPEKENPDCPLTFNIVSDKEGYVNSSFTLPDEGKGHKFYTRINFTYHKEGGRYRILFNTIAVGSDDNWEVTNIDGADYPVYCTENKQEKTITLTYGDNEELTMKMKDVTIQSWPGPQSSSADKDQAKTKDDVLGKWIGGFIFPFPVMTGECNITFTKKGDVYSASGRTNCHCREFKGVNYDISFSNCSYTVDNGMVVIEKVAGDKRIEMKTMRNMTASVEVLEEKFNIGMPNMVIHLPDLP